MTYQEPGWGRPEQGPAGAPGPGGPGQGSPGGPPPYQYQGGYAPPQTDGMAIAALVLAICSFVVFPVIPAIIALVLASSSRRKISESGGRLTGESLNKVAVIISWINLAIAMLVVALLIIVLIAAAGSA